MENINGLIKKINMMPKGKEKALKTCFFYTYISFLLESKQINNDEALFYSKQINEPEYFLKQFFQEERLQVNNVLFACEKLTSLYKSILNYANNYNLFTIPLPNINIKKLMYNVRQFFDYLDPEINKLFDLNYHVVKRNLDLAAVLGCDTGEIKFKHVI